MSGEKVQIEFGAYRFDGYHRLSVNAGNRGTRRIVPPAGKKHAFDLPNWARRIEVSVSPTGRSARVWVDGVEII